MKVRIASEGDSGVLQALGGSVLQASGMRDVWNAAVAEGEVIVADHEERVAGLAWLQPHGFLGYPFLRLLVVGPEYRRRGVGSALLAAGCEHARADRVFTSTNTSNVAMRALCEKSGWAECGQVHALDPGDPEVFYVRWVTTDQIIEAVAKALDDDDFSRLESLLEADVSYSTGDAIIRGSAEVVQTFRRNSEWGRAHIESVTFRHRLDRANRNRILFTDLLRHNGEEFVHTMTMDVALSPSGRVRELRLRYPGGERERLREFFQRVGIE